MYSENASGPKLGSTNLALASRQRRSISATVHDSSANASAAARWTCALTFFLPSASRRATTSGGTSSRLQWYVFLSSAGRLGSLSTRRPRRVRRNGSASTLSRASSPWSSAALPRRRRRAPRRPCRGGRAVGELDVEVARPRSRASSTRERAHSARTERDRVRLLRRVQDHVVDPLEPVLLRLRGGRGAVRALERHGVGGPRRAADARSKIQRDLDFFRKGPATPVRSAFRFFARSTTCLHRARGSLDEAAG